MSVVTVNLSAQSVVEDLRRLPRRCQTLLVGIDGGGGAGKSTLAGRLQQAGAEISVVHMDDFYKPGELRRAGSAAEAGSDFDWRRLLDQVLAPLAGNAAACYQRYDWDEDRLAEWYTLRPGGIVTVEGCYAIRSELANLYDFRIWVETPRGVRLARGVERDGEEQRSRWELYWMPAEDRYAAEQAPRLRADAVLDGSGASVDDLLHFIRLPAGWVGGCRGTVSSGGTLAPDETS